MENLNTNKDHLGYTAPIKNVKKTLLKLDCLLEGLHICMSLWYTLKTIEKLYSE